MKNTVAGFALVAALSTGAYAATTTMSAVPNESWTVTNYYKQAVYDPNDSFKSSFPIGFNSACGTIYFRPNSRLAILDFRFNSFN